MSKGMNYTVGLLIGVAIGEAYGLYVLGPIMESLEAALGIGLGVGIVLGGAFGIYLKDNA